MYVGRSGRRDRGMEVLVINNYGGMGYLRKSREGREKGGYCVMWWDWRLWLLVELGVEGVVGSMFMLGVGY